MNILDTSAIEQCTSCQMCAAVCSTKAISIKLDDNGFYRPYIDSDKCIDCSLCTKVCYKFHSVTTTSNEELNHYTLFSAASLDKDLLSSCTSGGVATVLARYLFEKGYKCIGVTYDYQKHIAYHKRAITKDDIESFKGSKYIQSYTYDCFKELIKGIKGENKYAVFCSPCQAYALDRFLNIKKKRDKFLLIDFYCHGCPSLTIWQKYISKLKESYNINTIDDVKFRSKAKGWGEFCVQISYDNNKKFLSGRKHDEFYELFFSNLLLNDVCRDCKLRGSLRYADIRVGDFWGDLYETNTKGVSAVTLISDEGKLIFNEIKNSFKLKKHSFDGFLPYQSWSHAYDINLDTRNILFSLLKDKSLKEVVSFYHKNQSNKEKVKRHLKNIVKLAPLFVINWVKYIYHKK